MARVTPRWTGARLQIVGSSGLAGISSSAAAEGAGNHGNLCSASSGISVPFGVFRERKKARAAGGLASPRRALKKPPGLIKQMCADAVPAHPHVLSAGSKCSSIKRGAPERSRNT